MERHASEIQRDLHALAEITDEGDARGDRPLRIGSQIFRADREHGLAGLRLDAVARIEGEPHAGEFDMAV